MERKRWVIVEELEKLTEENAGKYLSPSIYGQAKIKGKYVRDKSGKLVPVLVRIERKAILPVEESRDAGVETRWARAFNRVKKLLSFLTPRR